MEYPFLCRLFFTKKNSTNINESTRTLVSNANFFKYTFHYKKKIVTFLRALQAKF